MRGSLSLSLSLSLVTVALVGCTDDHHVRLLLGPTEDSLSGGFTCSDESKPGSLLAQRALTTDNTLQFNLVVDIVDLGGTFPSCLGEDVAATCAHAPGAGCTLAVSAAPTRFCKQVSIPNVTSTAQASSALLAFVHANFNDVFGRAPHAPVLVRAVATLQPCSDLVTTGSAVWPDLDPAAAVGCAYSCPIDLDDAPGEVSLGLGVPVGTGDANASSCDAVIRGCTVFPAFTN